MKNIKIIAFVLVLALSISVLSACSVSGNASVPADITDGRFIYSVVRGKDSGQVIGDAAKSIRVAIKENMKCTSSLIKDDVAEPQEDSCEILVGNTNRIESQQTLKILTDNRTSNSFDFIIKVINNKICIQATTDEMIEAGCKCFIKNYCQSMDSWKNLKGNLEFLYTPDVKMVNNKVNGVDVGRFTLVKPLQCEYLIGIEIEKIQSFYKNYGLTMNYITDRDSAATNEILVGDTTREESKSVSVEGDNYVIKVVGGKIVIKGGNSLSASAAARHFNRLLKESENGKVIDWNDGYVINGKYDPKEKDTYTLNFDDEFNSSNLDIGVWGDYNYASTRTSPSTLGGTKYSINPKGETVYKGKLPNKYVYQADGNLVIASGKIGEKDFIGTDISTYYSMLYKYGMLEIRSKLAKTPASVSFWLNGTGEQNLVSRYGNLGRSCFSEYDLLENYGSQNWFGSNVHRWWTDYSADMQSSHTGHNSMGGNKLYYNEENNANYKFDVEANGGRDLSDEYHIYSMYWDDDGIKFAFDGKKFCDYSFEKENSVAVHSTMDCLILGNNMSAAGYGAAWKEGMPTYCECFIDYVRVYQTGAIGSQMVKSYSEFVEKRPTVLMYPDKPVKNSY